MKFIFVLFILAQTMLAALTPAEALSLIRGGVRNAPVSQTRAEISLALKSIVIPEVKELEGYTMTEVISFLDLKIKEHNLRINLIINPNLTQAPINVGVNPVVPVAQIDPVTGLPVQQVVPNREVNDKVFSSDDIKVVGLKNKLRNLNILQLLEVVTQSFDAPIQYSITDYGVIFFAKPADQVGIFSRILKMNLNAINNVLNKPPLDIKKTKSN